MKTFLLILAFIVFGGIIFYLVVYLAFLNAVLGLGGYNILDFVLENFR
ncbi:hypothetical protein ACFFK0_01360 [Paenibacillus chartarius]|uniref:Uncharacterized protein n=1 Tax=Paenibacillus chartarius TaxID=747481 RepID=A0ABV6DEM8_9BACL